LPAQPPIRVFRCQVPSLRYKKKEERRFVYIFFPLSIRSVAF
jgi:hypothetical protein